MIELKHVSINFVKNFYSLYNVNLQIESNTILLGDTTSGNNFLLRLISKTDKHYEGEIFVDNINLKQIKDKDLPIAYITKENYFFNNKSVLENLIYPLKIRKICKNDAILRAKNEILPYFLDFFKIFNETELNQNAQPLNKNKILNENFEENLNKFLNTKIKHLNFSAQKILSLIRAKIRKPKYVLIENLFENLNENCFDLANKIVLDLTKNSVVIACTNETQNIRAYKNFNTIVFDAGSIKKDDV